MRANGRVILLDLPQRQLGPTGQIAGVGQAPVQADLLDRPHPALAEAAIATAAFTLPRGSTAIHQFWAFNPALPLPTQLPTRALEVLALPSLIRWPQATEEPLPTDAAAGRVAQPLHRLVPCPGEGRGWWTQPCRAGDGCRRRTLRPLHALTSAYRGPEAYYLNFYGPPGSFLSISAADLLVPDATEPDQRRRSARAGRLRRLAGAGKSRRPSDSFPTAFQSRQRRRPQRRRDRRHGVRATCCTARPWAALPEWARTTPGGAAGLRVHAGELPGHGVARARAHARARRRLRRCGSRRLRGWQLWLPVVVPLLGLLPLAIGLGQAVHYLGAARWLGVYAPRQVSQHLLKGRRLRRRPAADARGDGDAHRHRRLHDPGRAEHARSGDRLRQPALHHAQRAASRPRAGRRRSSSATA